jgi:hypothetical protein
MWAAAPECVFLGAAGVVAGVASSAGAIGSIISYPALLAVGIPALPANVTNAVAAVAAGVGSTAGSRPELKGTAGRLVRWSLITAAGAALGAALLLLTPGALFEWIVPFLVALAAMLLFAQPRIIDRRTARGRGVHRAVLPLGLFAVSVYDGYFGAASGIMTLAVLMLTVETRLLSANALKNALLAIADVVAAVGFIAFGPVRWLAAVALGLGLLAGGATGPALARRLPADALRVAIAGSGVLLAGWLLYRAAGS